MQAGVTKRYTSADCTLCSHEERYEFDRALVLKQVTQVQVARQIGCSKMSVSRHFRNHLLPEMGDLLGRQRDRADLDILAEVETLFLDLRDRYEVLKDWSDDRQVIPRYHAELRKDLKLLGEITGQLDSAKTKVEVDVHIEQQVTQQFLQVNQVILSALSAFPDAKLAVAAALKVDQ